MRILGTVIIPAYQWDEVNTLERGYRTVMWKYHEALTLIANRSTDPVSVARNALGRDRPPADDRDC